MLFWKKEGTKIRYAKLILCTFVDEFEKNPNRL
jgi:hypothetical protein